VQRYGYRNLIIFFLIKWVVSFSFEALSIHTGFPFGWYYYAMPAAISILGVPLIIIFAYFGTGYFAWMLAHVFTGRYNKKLNGKWIVVVPFIAAFLMVMWDVSADPVSSTLWKQWIWLQPGAYFGVPIQNFFGWLLVVLIFYQTFPLFLSKYDRINPLRMLTLAGKLYWTKAAVVYGIIGLQVVFLVRSINNDIAQSMALIAMFTMIIVAILAYLAIYNNSELT
jgi:hypothetical protein